MGKLFTKEQARAFLAEGNFKDGDAIANALTEGFKDLIQEVLEAELTNKFGYSRYDWKNKQVENARNGHAYFYLVANKKVNGEVRQRVLKYLGKQKQGSA